MKKIARLFRVLSDETRLRILALLTTGKLRVCDLVVCLGRRLVNVAFQLRERVYG